MSTDMTTLVAVDNVNQVTASQIVSTRMITLVAGDGVSTVTVPEAVARKSKTINDMLEDIGDGTFDNIPLQNISIAILTKVVEYCTKYKDIPFVTNKTDEEKLADKTAEISEWDKDFCNVDQSVLFELILAANQLDIKPLLDVSCKTIANMIKGKSPEEIRKTFNIKNDFTPEEEEQIRKDNEWCTEVESSK